MVAIAEQQTAATGPLLFIRRNRRCRVPGTETCVSESVFDLLFLLGCDLPAQRAHAFFSICNALQGHCYNRGLYAAGTAILRSLGFLFFVLRTFINYRQWLCQLLWVCSVKSIGVVLLAEQSTALSMYCFFRSKK